MTNTRGRPKGSEKNDSRALNAVADMLHADPTLKPTTAMRRHNRMASDADIRRWQGKWKDRSLALLAAAAERVADRQRQTAPTNTSVARRSLETATEAARRMQEVYNSPTMRVMREFQESPTARALYEAQNSPAMRAMREVYNSPEMRAAREVYDSPTMRIARQIAEAGAKLNGLLGSY